MEIRKTTLFLKSALCIVAILLALAVSIQVAKAGSHPNMYLNQEEIDAIKIKVATNAEPWTSAYNKVKSAADTAMTQVKLESVTYQGPVKSSKHAYFTESPYCGWPTAPFCRDGQISGNADRGDYEAAIRLGDVVRDLGLSYVFTGEAKYAEKVIDFIRTWSLDADTRMTPIPGNRIETYITFPGYFYGADLIWNYAGWDPVEKTAFQAWVKSMGDYVFRNGEGNNNFSNWRIVMLASAGALLNDASYLALAQSEWIRLLPIQMNGAGSSRAGLLGQEAGRTRGLHYSMYALNAMIQGAEILRHRNVNLYDYEDVAGRGLELALDFITPYAITPALWGKDTKTSGYKQITPITQKDSMALYELAYSHYQKDSYWDAINRWGRPMDETRVMGITTLTHASRDLSLEPTSPSITTQPESVTVSEGEDASFNVVATGSGPLRYQWYFNGAAIAGANSASYMLTAVSASDAGSYGCIVTNAEGSEGCNDATLEVSPDVTAPSLISALAVSDTRVDILFSEAVAQSSAENSTNYQIDLGIGVSSAALNDDGRRVSLMVSPALMEDTTYMVSVSNVKDLATEPNTIAALSSKTFTYRIADDFEDGVADGWTPFNNDGEMGVNRWEVVEDEGDQAYFLKVTNYTNLDEKRLGEYSLLSAQYGDFTFTAQAKLGDDIDSNTHADYAVVFGFQDAKNYYYALFNNDQGSTQIAVVEDGIRVEIATAESDWLTDNAYQGIKVSRAGNEINVYFDGNRVMDVTDATFGVGQVGVGSYNDSAYFDDVKVVGQVTTTPDTTPPMITLDGNNPQKIILGTVYNEHGASATDDVDGDISDKIVINASAVNTNVVGTYEVRYKVKDAAGNVAQEKIRKVTVTTVTDTTPPVITLNGDNPQQIILGSVYNEHGASATDDVDGDISDQVTINASAVNTNAVGTYEVRYNVKDAAGNVAQEKIRKVTVSTVAADTTSPVITLNGDNPQQIILGTAYNEHGASATDNVDGDISGQIVIDVSAVDTMTAGSYPVSYNVSDDAGNAAMQVIRTVNVAQLTDTTPPVITLNGNASLTITVDGVYSELGATALDNLDGDISGKIVIDVSALDLTTIGSYAITYNVKDSAGNAATPITRTVNVTAATVISVSALGGPLLGLLGFLLLVLRHRIRLQALPNN